MTHRPLLYAALSALALILAAILFGAGLVWPILRPALPSGAPAKDFSGERAFEHIRAIASEPRPTGSPAIARTRDYLSRTLREISPAIETGVHETLVVESFTPGLNQGTRVRNVVARLPGTDSTRSLLLVAHYDSVVGAPGANDDGAGVAVILELVRTLAARGPHRNDVVALFTDAEERGMLGARGYVRDHPDGRAEVLVFNFEARGNSGPALMFQTGPRSAWLVREFARYARAPVGSSVAAELFGLLPYGTDFSVFARQGRPGLNFAYINNTVYYHSMLDAPGSVDLRSLQHHGDNVLELLHALANRDLSALPESEGAPPDGAVFVPLAFPGGSRLLVYDAGWQNWLLAFALLIYTLFFIVLNRELRPGRFGAAIWSFCLPLVVAVAGALCVAAIWYLIRYFHPQYAAILFTGETYHAIYYKAALSCVAALSIATVYGLAARRLVRHRRGAFWAGGLAFWLLAAALASVFAPGVAYVFLWPLLFYVPVCGWIQSVRGDGPLSQHDLMLLTLGLPVVGVILGPLVRYLVFGLMTLPVQPAAAFLYAPCLALIAPLLLDRRLNRARRAAFAAFLVALFILLWRADHLARYGPAQPRPNSLFYVWNADAQQAAWFSCDARLDEWTAPVLAQPRERPARAPRLRDYLPVLRACLPGFHQPHAARAYAADSWRAAVPAPLAIVRRDRMLATGLRELTLQLRSDRGAPALYALFRFSGELRAARLDGVAIDPERLQPPPRILPWWRRWLGSALQSVAALDGQGAFLLASSGKADFELILEWYAPEGRPEVEVRLVDHSYGLPESIDIAPRPPDTIAGERYPFSDGTFAVRSFRF